MHSIGNKQKAIVQKGNGQEARGHENDYVSRCRSSAVDRGVLSHNNDKSKGNIILLFSSDQYPFINNYTFFINILCFYIGHSIFYAK